MRDTAIHIIQLVVHCYFMKQNFTANNLAEFWNQIKYLTNVSNLCMFLFLVPQVIQDAKYWVRRGWYTNLPRYSKLTYYAFQCMNPIIFLVMIMYWLLMYINPKLVFGDRDHTKFDQLLMFYVHGGNWMMMQLNYLTTQPQLRSLNKAIIYFTYVLMYFGIYGIHYYIYEEHVYGFQALLGKFELVTMYSVLFVILFMLDQICSIALKSRHTPEVIQVKHK